MLQNLLLDPKRPVVDTLMKGGSMNASDHGLPANGRHRTSAANSVIRYA